jgi:hypothetical protein
MMSLVTIYSAPGGLLRFPCLHIYLGFAFFVPQYRADPVDVGSGLRLVIDEALT